MSNIKEMGLIELNENDIKSIDGGILLVNYRELLEAFTWAYQEFKTGVNDGYNNK